MFLTNDCVSSQQAARAAAQNITHLSYRVYFHLLWKDLFIGPVLPVRITLEALLLLKWSRHGFAFNRWGSAREQISVRLKQM